MPSVLSIDTTSPHLSVALACEGSLLASTSAPQRQASARLLPLITEVLARAQRSLSSLDGLVALRGPGSFTGIRIGLATAQGINQSTNLPATGWSTLEVIAQAAPPGAGRVLTLVHALRDEWYCQTFSSDSNGIHALEEPRRRRVDELAEMTFDQAVQIAPEREAKLPFPAIIASSPAELAAIVASRSTPTWDARLLANPLYLAPPPASLPKGPKAVLPLDT